MLLSPTGMPSACIWSLQPLKCSVLWSTFFHALDSKHVQLFITLTYWHAICLYLVITALEMFSFSEHFLPSFNIPSMYKHLSLLAICLYLVTVSILASSSLDHFGAVILSPNQCHVFTWNSFLWSDKSTTVNQHMS